MTHSDPPEWVTMVIEEMARLTKRVEALEQNGGRPIDEVNARILKFMRMNPIKLTGNIIAENIDLDGAKIYSRLMTLVSRGDIYREKLPNKTALFWARAYSPDEDPPT